MTILSIILVGLGGSIGALLRFSFSEKWNSGSFPTGTLAVNWFGSFFLGALIGAGFSGHPFLFAGTGMAGALTTFSTMQLEGITLYKRIERKRFLLYQFISYTGGIALAWAGMWAGRLFH
ncbi:MULTISPECIES: fluoride efflux transporter FluC [Salimicrobium]|uniref:Fluoride-specific ion channel FluC n=2 Tax=Salimicrobium TaxID=351195 RepID=K2GJA6_9BACI|nr:MULTISPECIES: CrcB family protein [Salimicrobium]AKG04798.1 hypothetical protein AAV35_008280 [Salimicrobium jeotgali]EKE30539.1 hypothetical protein MJ3_12724 [Salimicrobium jeotgali]MBM7696771.1 CrcB protein [Salimicrobium jeotgali]SDX39131.1 camphor resistance protein CrcB [Salimicrobium album]